MDDDKQNHVDRTIDSSLKPDEALEAHVQSSSDAIQLNPLVTKIHQKFGAFNFIRNARNTRQAAVDDIGS